MGGVVSHTCFYEYFSFFYLFVLFCCMYFHSFLFLYFAVYTIIKCSFDKFFFVLFLLHSSIMFSFFSYSVCFCFDILNIFVFCFVTFCHLVNFSTIRCLKQSIFF